MNLPLAPSKRWRDPGDSPPGSVPFLKERPGNLLPHRPRTPPKVLVFLPKWCLFPGLRTLTLFFACKPID
jgi:hypothetical protein